MPPRLASMVAVNDRDGVVTFLHDAHNSGNDETLKLIAGVYDRAEEDIRRSLMFVLAHINTPEADQVLIQIAEADPSHEVRQGALRSITVRSEAVELLHEEKVLDGRAYFTGEIPSDYQYPIITEQQEQALTSSLERIVLDNEQFLSVRLEAYRILEPGDKQAAFANEAMMSSEDPFFTMDLIRLLGRPEQYRSELMQLYHTAPDVHAQSGALQMLADIGAVEALPYMVDVLLAITPEEKQWGNQTKNEREIFGQKLYPPEFTARMSMNWAINLVYIRAEQGERDGIANLIDGKLAPSLMEIERHIESGFISEVDRGLVIKKLETISFMISDGMVNGFTIQDIDIPAKNKARELLRQFRSWELGIE